MRTRLRRLLEALEAERLAPVPRADRVVAVDAADLALLIEHASLGVRAPPEAWEAYWRLEKAARRPSAT